MATSMQVLSDMDVDGSVTLLHNFPDFPLNPKIGQFCLVNNEAFIYMVVDGMETWYPFASKTNSFLHTQALANATWTVNHGLKTTNVWVQIKDSLGNIMYASMTPIDANSFQLKFTTPVTGTVFVVAPDSIDVPTIKALSISVANGAVEIDNSGIKINGTYVLTQATLDGMATQAALDAHTSSRTNPHNVTKTQVGLSNVDNTSDLNKPVSTATQTALDSKLDVSALPSVVSAFTNDSGYQTEAQVTSAIAGKANTSSLAMVALSGAYSDLTGKPAKVSDFQNDLSFQTASEVSTAIQAVVDAAPAALDTLKELATELTNSESTVATLITTVSTKADVSYVDAQVALKAATSALSPVAFSGSFLDLSHKPTTDSVSEGTSNLYFTVSRASAAAPVQSVAGKTGTIVLNKSDVGLSSVDNTSDAAKPVSTAQQAALDGKVSIVTGKDLSTNDYTNAEKSKLAGIEAGAQVNLVTSVAGRTGAVSLVKADVGLGAVDNTSDANKPISLATQAALDAKANASAIYTKAEVDAAIAAAIEAFAATLYV